MKTTSSHGHLFMIQLFSRLALTLLAMAVSGTLWSQALYLNGHKAMRDCRGNMWLCSVPRDVFGSDWTASVEFDSTWTDVTINGLPVLNGTPVTLENIQGGKSYPITAHVADSTMSGNLTFTWLPVMELEGTFGNEYTEALVGINMPDSCGADGLRAKVKWRGNVTNHDKKHKRNYHIKFLDEDGNKTDRRLFGLRKDNHWKLDAGQPDRLRVRNRVCADLWLDMSRPVWYQPEEPTAINGSRGQLVEVMLNGQYQGIYNVMEPVDRKQLKLVKHDTINNTFHGQLWYNRVWCRTGTMSKPIAWSNDSRTWDGFEVEYPDFDEVSPTDWSTLADAIFFTNRTELADQWPQLADSLDDYFDMPMMEDYFIFIVTVQALDNESKNVYYGVHDKTIDTRLTMTPWDLDVSLGAQSFSFLTPEIVSPERPLDWISHLPMVVMFNLSPRHRNEVLNRYWQLRQTWLHTDSLVARVERAINELEQCGAAGREELRWSGDSDIGGAVLDLSAEMEYVTDWIRRRMAYLDQYLFVMPTSSLGDVNADGEITVADINAMIDVVLDGTEDNGLASRCDINADNEINIADINALIELIMQKN